MSAVRSSALCSRWKASCWRPLCTCTFISPVETHAPLCVASSWMSLVCHGPHCPSLQIMSILICTYLARLMHAWHSNFTALSRVCTASGGTSRLWFIYQMKKILFWIIEQVHDWQAGWWNWRGSKEKRKRGRQIGVVKLTDIEDNFSWGVDTDTKCGSGVTADGQNGWRASVLNFLLFQWAKRYPRKSIKLSLTFITFNLAHISFTIELIAFAVLGEQTKS